MRSRAYSAERKERQKCRGLACNWRYQLKIDCVFYVNPMVTTKEIPIEVKRKRNQSLWNAKHTKWNTKNTAREKMIK